MKRSEAIDNIACVIVSFLPRLPSQELLSISKEILDDIETRTNMLPPIEKGAEQYKILCKWEPEDKA